MNDSLSTLTTKQSSSAPRRRLPAWSLPLAILLGFGLLFLLLLRDRILPAPSVEVAVVIGVEFEPPAETGPAKPSRLPARQRFEGPMAFQASGWIEPDPLPTKATALVNGVVDEVHVLEGDTVRKGQLLVTLIRTDMELAVKTARSELRTREAMAKAHRSEALAAEMKVAAAEAMYQASVARHDETADRLQRIEGLTKGALAETELTTIRSNERNARAAMHAASAAVEQAKAEAISANTQCEVLEQQIETAKVALETAELAYERTEIRSPIDGRVLALHAVPGKKKMLNMDNEDSATIATLYQPAQLQVRVDVPLADAGGLQIGQLTRVKCNLLPDTTFTGEVTRISGEADIARNTLQAKVHLHQPSDQLRPEMLCRVEFLETRREGAPAIPRSRSLATWVPEEALDGEQVWVCDPESQRIEKRAVVIAADRREGKRRIEDGLRPGEWVVLSPAEGLRAGQRVKPRTIKP